MNGKNRCNANIVLEEANELTFPYDIQGTSLKGVCIYQIYGQKIWDNWCILFSPATSESRKKKVQELNNLCFLNLLLMKENM